MCFSSPSSGSSAAATSAIQEQLNKGNALLSNEKVAATTTEKKGTKRTVTSLRIPLKNKTKTETMGINTAEDSATGLNIPI